MADQPPGGLTGRDADLHPTGPSSRFKSLLPLLLAVAGVIAWSVSLSSIHPYAAPASGLVSQLSVLWWLGVALAAAGIVLELSRESPRTIIMIPTLIALALILHGTLPATEPVSRFSAAYVVAGFSDYIGRTGTALPRLDVRMSWPAMFAATGMAARAMGVSTLWFLRWCPLVLNLATRVFAIGGVPLWPVSAFVETRTWARVKRFGTNALQLPYGAIDVEQPETDTTVGYRVAMLT